MRVLFKFPKVIIVLLIGITCIFALKLPGITIDSSVKNFLPAGHPSRKTTETMDSVFGGNEMISVSVQFEKGTIFDKENLLFVSHLTKQIENVDHVKDVLSLTNAEVLYSRDGGMVNDPIVKGLPETE